MIITEEMLNHNPTQAVNFLLSIFRSNVVHYEMLQKTLFKDNAYTAMKRYDNCFMVLFTIEESNHFIKLIKSNREDLRFDIDILKSILNRCMYEITQPLDKNLNFEYSVQKHNFYANITRELYNFLSERGWI